MRTGLLLDEAQRLVLDATPRLGAEIVAARDALGRVLAEPVVSGRTLPPADNSAMDGFAVQAADLAGAGPGRALELPLAFEVAAGAEAPRRLESGQAARIFTGAPLPPGADAVVRQEDADWDARRVRIRVGAVPGENVRRAGEDVRSGETVLDPGTVLGPAPLGMLASLGRTMVSVVQRPRVAILSGGDELVEPDQDPGQGRIVSSNSYSLAALVREVGGQPSYLGIARDDPEDLERRLRAGLRADVLVSSAGVSVGDRDHVREVLEKLGCTLVFWGVEMKPGYPVVFGRFADDRGPLVFGLPGNPVSAMVTFEQLVRPALRKLLGHSAWFRPQIRVRLAETLRKRPGRLHLVRVHLERRGSEVVARSTGSQSSGVLRSMTLAQGLLVFPLEAQELPEGAQATVQVIDPEFLAGSDAGLGASP